MACTAISTGQGFLVETLSHLDCQAQVIGSYGFQSLADPGSPATTILTALLTLFIALFGVRLLFGGEVGLRDGVGAVIKIGIVLTLAVSWPAFRTLAYDTVLHGPSQIAASIGGSSVPDMRRGLAQRLQGIDNEIVAMTAVGTGRQSGSLDVPEEQRGSFESIALQDETALGWGRTVFLGATIGSLALLRVAAGLLLAITPLIAGLLLFDLTRGLFAGWFRGLAFTALGSLGIALLLAVQVAVMEPWITDALDRRSLGYATPTFPSELLAIAIGFGVAAFALLGLLAKVAFQADWLTTVRSESHFEMEQPSMPQVNTRQTIRMDETIHSRALAVGEGVRNTMRHETRRSEYSQDRRTSDAATRPPDGRWADAQSREALGSSWRRNARRTTGSQQRRDTKP